MDYSAFSIIWGKGESGSVDLWEIFLLYLFNKYFLSNYYVPPTGETGMSKQTRILALIELTLKSDGGGTVRKGDSGYILLEEPTRLAKTDGCGCERKVTTGFGRLSSWKHWGVTSWDRKAWFKQNWVEWGEEGFCWKSEICCQFSHSVELLSMWLETQIKNSEKRSGWRYNVGCCWFIVFKVKGQGEIPQEVCLGGGGESQGLSPQTPGLTVWEMKRNQQRHWETRQCAAWTAR